MEARRLYHIGLLDSVEMSKSGSANAARLEELIDAVGEGLHGDERDTQAVKLEQIRPGPARFLVHTEFICSSSLWVKKTTTVTKKEKAEERENALQAFLAVVDAESNSMSSAKLAAVMWRLGTTCTDKADYTPRIFNCLAKRRPTLPRRFPNMVRCVAFARRRCRR